MKVLIAPNYFKGSLSAVEAVDVISEALNSADDDLDIDKCPLADGGDGTIDAVYSSRGGNLINIEVNDSLCRKINAAWLKLEDEYSTAVIEAARANGLSLLKPQEYNPFIATTYGVGEFITDALNHNCKKIIIGVGGSATNDAGYGALKALGVRFLDKNGKEISNDIRSFENLFNIDISGLRPDLKDAELYVATDVINPLTGKKGASYTYAKQKGASEEDIIVLDKLLSNFADVCQRIMGIDNRFYEGAGAAGGLAYGLNDIAGAGIINGFDMIAELINLEQRVCEADLVITGEGRLDEQTLWGKAPFRLARLAKKYNKPCIAIVGSSEKLPELDKYFKDIYSLADDNISTQQSMANAATLLKNLVIKNNQKILQDH